VTQYLKILTLALRRLGTVTHSPKHRRCVVTYFEKLTIGRKYMLRKQLVQIEPLQLGVSEHSIVEVVAIHKNYCSHVVSLKMTKPPEGGLSP